MYGLRWGGVDVVTTKEYVVEEAEERIDLFLARSASDLTRSQVQRLLEEGCVLLNGSTPRSSRKLNPGDRIRLIVPPPRPMELVPQAIPLNIGYQDSELLVVDKPAGLTVHPAPGHPSHTLVNALLAICPDLKGIGGELRPGIVHRLDKDTSGLMVVAKSGAAHTALSEQIKDRTVLKGYLALAKGRVDADEGVIDAPVGRDPRNRKRMAVVDGGRSAVTRYKAIQRFREHTLLELVLETGRTHQIRVHLASRGHPLEGDMVYGGKPVILDRQFLHAQLLGFRHPATGEYRKFTSPLPEDLQRCLEGLVQ